MIYRKFVQEPNVCGLRYKQFNQGVQINFADVVKFEYNKKIQYQNA